ncbi:MAG: diaminopimelate decarboxylase [Pseudomonadales bacterium]|nr:diaminopimelate decarboxylase [Pseudomonadales bacterium]
MNPFTYQNDELFAEQVALSEIAETYGTPTFVYSCAAITEAYQRFSDAFATHKHQICYAVKANSNLGVLTLLNSLGAGFDIVSGGELTRVLKAGANPGSVVFSGVGKLDWEITQSLEAGIGCFNIESDSELTQVNRLAAASNTRAPISIRVNPDVDAKTHPYISTGLKENKFGVSVSEALKMYARAKAMKHIDILGIDCHIGSQITELGPFLEALERILELVDLLERQDIKLQHIDLGGGIGVQYQNEETIDIGEYSAAILQSLGHRTHQLLFEPGRYIVANAGLLLSRVIHKKTNEGKNFAIIDAAMNDLIRPTLYQSWQAVSSIKQPTGKTEQLDLVGPVCETGDTLAKDRALEIDQNDLVAIHSAGAYGFVMSSNYNSRNKAAEIMVNGATAHCIRERESIQDQMRLEYKFTP